MILILVGHISVAASGDTTDASVHATRVGVTYPPIASLIFMNVNRFLFLPLYDVYVLGHRPLCVSVRRYCVGLSVIASREDFTYSVREEYKFLGFRTKLRSPEAESMW